MKVVVIGGSGHVGSFLVPRLVRAGHEVVSISRGQREPYVAAEEWGQVTRIVADRQAEDRDGSFPRRVSELGADVVIDLVCFTLDSAQALVEALRGNCAQLLHCGTLWRFGPSVKQPLDESMERHPVGDYGTRKEAIALMLKEVNGDGGLLTSSIHPGHIVGPGWNPIGPVGNFDPQAWWALSAGEPLRIPGFGADMMHHVHADDVAQLFERAMDQREASAGEDFLALSPHSLTVRGYAQIAAGWFGRSAQLESVSWEEYRAEHGDDLTDCSWEHLWRSHCGSIGKARRVLGYEPRYESDEAILESVRWLIDNEQLKVANPLVV